MIRTISWRKIPFDRFYRSGFEDYIFKENDTDIGFLRMKYTGLLSKEIFGDLFNQKIEFKDKYQSVFSIYTNLFDKETNEYLGKITGSISIGGYKRVIYKKLIEMDTGASFTVQIERRKVSFWKSEIKLVVYNDDKIELMSSLNPISEKGELVLNNEISGFIFLASFYILMQFMDLKERD